MSELQKLQDAACSDGNCVFKITPEMRKGMRTNGGCCCLKDMTYGIGHHKTHGVMELSRIASDAEAALAAKDAEIAEKDARIAELERQLKEGTEDGSRCNRRCEGVMVMGQPENCSCHLSAPCGPCENNRPECSMCGAEVE